MNDAVELADLISQLRSDLSRAMHEGQDSELQFEAGPIELEVSVNVEKSIEPGVKVRLWVVDVNANGNVARTSAQRIKLTLIPRLLGHPERSPLIAGLSLPDER